MQSFAILYPAFAMALLTFTVAVLLLKTRIASVKAGTTKLSYFKFNEGEISAQSKQVEQHYINLFEMPVLFYAIVIIVFVTQTSSVGLIFLAWAYVVARAAHSYIHLSSNKVMYRMRAFLVSYAVLAFMWIWVLIALWLR